MTATGQNFSMYQGDTRNLNVTCLGVDDLSSSDLTWVSYRLTNNAIVLTKTTASGGGITVSGASNIFTVAIEPSDTLSLLGLYKHECELKDATGNISTIFVGKMTVLKSKANNA
jgi:hypothetical protein